MNRTAYINQNMIKVLENFFGNFGRCPEDKVIADEAISRLRKYEDGEYLCNIFPDDRPEWIAARKLILDQYN